MRYLFILGFLSFSVFSQQKVIKTIDRDVKDISILSFGLDYIQITNSDSDTNQIEIELQDVNAKSYQIAINKINSLCAISFKKVILGEEIEVFRKFITKRIHKVNAILKIPKNKTITIFGKDVDVYSKSYHGDLKIYIDKGEIQLNQIRRNTEIRLFNGNVFATVFNTNINVISNNGSIVMNKKQYSKSLKKEVLNTQKTLKISSINANIILQNN